MARVARFAAGLKRIAAAAGHPEKYHATITHAFAFLVGRWIAAQGSLSWDEFVATNPDLFDWPNIALTRMYPGDTLRTPVARQTFVLPVGESAADEAVARGERSPANSIYRCTARDALGLLHRREDEAGLRGGTRPTRG